MPIKEYCIIFKIKASLRKFKRLKYNYWLIANCSLNESYLL